MSATPSRDEQGAATMLVLVMAAILLFVGVALAGAASLVITQRRAQAAADLSALAGAGAVISGADGCARAGQLAAANEAVLERCELTGGDVRVEVRVAGPRLVGRAHDVTAWARAGPVVGAD